MPEQNMFPFYSNNVYKARNRYAIIYTRIKARSRKMIVFLIKTKRPLLPFPDALQLALPFYIPLMLQHRYIMKLYFIHKRLTALTVKEKKKLQQKDLVLQQGSGIAVNAPGALNERVTSDLVNNRRAEVKAIRLFFGEKLIGR